MVTVVPLRSNTDRVLPFEVLIEAAEFGLGVDSKAQAEQVRSVAANRIGDRIGVLPFELMQRLDEALRLHLDL